MFDRSLQFISNKSETFWIFIAILSLSALLEVVGDVVVARALTNTGIVRLLLIFAGGVVLLTYSLLINATGKELAPMLATYVACFFFVSQLMKPSTITLRSAVAFVLVAIAAWLCWPQEK